MCFFSPSKSLSDSHPSCISRGSPHSSGCRLQQGPEMDWGDHCRGMKGESPKVSYALRLKKAREHKAPNQKRVVNFSPWATNSIAAFWWSPAVSSGSGGRSGMERRLRGLDEWAISGPAGGAEWNGGGLKRWSQPSYPRKQSRVFDARRAPRGSLPAGVKCASLFPH